MAQDREQQQPHGAGQHANGGDSMQSLVIRLLLAASQTSEPVASELKDIAMSLSCATMAAIDDSSSVGGKDEPSSSRNSAVPSLGMLRGGTSAPPLSRDGSRGDIATSTALVLRDEATAASLRDAAPPSQPQQHDLGPHSNTRPFPSLPGLPPSLQLDFGQRGFSTAGAKRLYPFDDSNVTEPKRQQMGRRPVCRECFSAGLAGTCDHTARCDNCRTRSNVNCVYVACPQGASCTAPQCHFMHPDQWSKNDRPVWQLKTAHLPVPPGAAVPAPRPVPQAPKPRRKKDGLYGRRPWAAPRQMPWTSGSTFTANRPFQPPDAGPLRPMAPPTAFSPFQNGAAAPPPPPAASTLFTFPKVELGAGNASIAGPVAAAASDSDLPRGLLKYEIDDE